MKYMIERKNSNGKKDYWVGGRQVWGQKTNAKQYALPQAKAVVSKLASASSVVELTVVEFN